MAVDTIDIYDLYNDFNAWVNSFQGGFFPPQSIFTRVTNIASLALWKKWTRQGEKSQEIKDNLFPFLVSQNIITKAANSYYATVDQPDNYGRFATAKILLAGDNNTCVPDQSVNNGTCMNGDLTTDQQLAEDYYDTVTEAEIEMIDNQRWSSMLKHLTKFPTFEKPKITQINNGFKVAPREVSVVVFNYYVKPQDAFFAYTVAAGNLQTGAGNQIIYNKNQSTQLQWPTTAKEDLLEELKLVYIGYTRDGLFQQINSIQKRQPIQQTQQP